MSEFAERKLFYLKFGLKMVLSDTENTAIFEEIVRRLSAKEINALIDYERTTQEGNVVYERLVPVLLQKMQEEGLTWEKLLKSSSIGDAFRTIAALAESGRLKDVFDTIEPVVQEKFIQELFVEFTHDPAHHAPDMGIIISGLKDSSLLGLVKNDIEESYEQSRTKEMRGILALLAGVAQGIAPEPGDSPFAKIAARGLSILARV